MVSGWDGRLTEGDGLHKRPGAELDKPFHPLVHLPRAAPALSVQVSALSLSLSLSLSLTHTHTHRHVFV